MPKNVFAADTLVEERANTIRALSVMQCASVLGAVTSATTVSLFEHQNITVFIPYIGFVCGAADLLCAVHFPRSNDRNKPINPYLVFGSLELLTCACCFRNDIFGWVGAVLLAYCGAERYLMAQYLAERRYVAPFERSGH